MTYGASNDPTATNDSVLQKIHAPVLTDAYFNCVTPDYLCSTTPVLPDVKKTGGSIADPASGIELSKSAATSWINGGDDRRRGNDGGRGYEQQHGPGLDSPPGLPPLTGPRFED